MVEKQRQEVWDILEEVVKEHPVMLNRAPTLHRLGIQAFEPVLHEGKAIQLHPLVCTAFNADFDGDQMAVHVPLSIEAQIEARVLMMSTNNILSPAHGKPIIVPSQDIVLGLYYMTRERPFAKGEQVESSRTQSMKFVRASRLVTLIFKPKIKCRINGKVEETTVGRALFSKSFHQKFLSRSSTKSWARKSLAELIDTTFRLAGNKKTVLLADNIMQVRIQTSDMRSRDFDLALTTCSCRNREERTSRRMPTTKFKKFENQYVEGLITDGERYNKVIDIWAQTSDKVATAMMKRLSRKEEFDTKGKGKESAPSFNSIFMMADSGARGSNAQIRQLAGMRGLLAKPSGEIIETPITANFREGLTCSSVLRLDSRCS